MRTILSTVLLLFLYVNSYSQKLSQVTFAGASTLSYFSFVIDQNVLVRISSDGKLMEWGTEVQSERSNNYFAPKLQPFMGRVDYYPEDADSAYRGKVKSIGTCSITYYSSLDKDDKPGKLKRIGIVMLDYYTQFENSAYKGKLRVAGSTVLEYYPALENEAIRGKLRSIGNTPIKYHTTFDDKLLQGKVKSIGSVSFQWGSSVDKKEFQGSLKSGVYRQLINGVTYILR